MNVVTHCVLAVPSVTTANLAHPIRNISLAGISASPVNGCVGRPKRANYGTRLGEGE